MLLYVPLVSHLQSMTDKLELTNIELHSNVNFCFLSVMQYLLIYIMLIYNVWYFAIYNMVICFVHVMLYTTV